MRNYAPRQVGSGRFYWLCIAGFEQITRCAWHLSTRRILAKIAADIRTILPQTQISFAADWSEYGAHVQANGDVGFPLDDFWADKNCDFVGIDNYLPLADWRDGPTHLDRQAGATDIYDKEYLAGNVRGGEYFDWYYASPANREAQKRTPIKDGGGAAWMFRAKDVQGWWENPHHRRVNGKQGAATAWKPKMKPLRFTELGCPAVDKGANQPNVFPDSLSSEGAVPYFSSGARDDHMQAAYLAAMIGHYRDAAHNPRLADGRAMLDMSDIYIWAWDARPFPLFPYRLDVWRDGYNWHAGHWLNGRHASAPLSPLFRALADDRVLLTQQVNGVIDGYAVRGISSAQQDMQPLLRAFAVDALAGEKHLRLHGRAINRYVNFSLRILSCGRARWACGAAGRQQITKAL